MRILQVSAEEARGGAAQVAHALHLRYRLRSHDSWMAVSKRTSEDPHVVAIPRVPAGSGAGAARRLLLGLARRAGASAARNALLYLAYPPTPFDLAAGTAQFYHPGSDRVPDLLPAPPDVVHVHNIHGRYLDVRALPALSSRFPVLLTLHDAWLLTGHCAHSLDCERWTTGCGRCPDLRIYPAMKRDVTAWGWRMKRDVFARSHLFVTTPCRWLMERVERSILAPAAVESRVIPNGVDLAVFRPGDRRAARAALGLPATARIVLFAAAGIRASPFKDFATMREAVGRAADRLRGEELIFLALGEAGRDEQVGAATIRFTPYTSNREAVADHYRAADLYVHAARAETFPNTVLEALACGTPVVATAVGGIPEQLHPLADGDAEGAHATGALTPLGDAEALARAMVTLLSDDRLRARLGANALRDARERFDLELQTDRYLSFYADATAARRSALGLVSSRRR